MAILNYFLVDNVIAWGECANDSTPFALFIDLVVIS